MHEGQKRTRFQFAVCLATLLVALRFDEAMAAPVQYSKAGKGEKS